MATAPGFTANNQAGTFTVTASTRGVTTPASFNLTDRTVHAAKRAAVTVTAPQNPTAGGSLPASMTFPTAPSFGKRS